MEFESAVVQRTTLSMIGERLLVWQEEEGRELLGLLESEGI